VAPQIGQLSGGLISSDIFGGHYRFNRSENQRKTGERSAVKIGGEATGVFVSADLEYWLRPRFDRFFTALD